MTIYAIGEELFGSWGLALFWVVWLVPLVNALIALPIALALFFFPPQIGMLLAKPGRIWKRPLLAAVYGCVGVAVWVGLASMSGATPD
jgi:hypothetical protein